jgi:hypothetical protein
VTPPRPRPPSFTLLDVLLALGFAVFALGVALGAPARPVMAVHRTSSLVAAEIVLAALVLATVVVAVAPLARRLRRRPA